VLSTRIFKSSANFSFYFTENSFALHYKEHKIINAVQENNSYLLRENQKYVQEIMPKIGFVLYGKKE
jgi:hypothetical protein